MFYNRDAIISVGYRVNSTQATQFRIWATQALREFVSNRCRSHGTLAKPILPVLWVVPNFIHEAARHVAGVLGTLLPGAHRVDGNTQELGENRLAGPQDSFRVSFTCRGP